MRFFRIIKIAIIYRLDKLLPNTIAMKIIRLFLLIVPYSYSKKGKLPRGERVTQALEQMGVIFVKFGQTLSTRVDLLPKDIGLELKKLQDNCTPFSNAAAVRIIEKSLNNKISEIFDNFSEQPLASASIAQVYTANLKNGDEVIIKVVRPNIDKKIAKDLKMLKRIAAILNLHKQLKRARPKQVIKEFEDIITLELNMKFEASNAEQLRANFKGNNLLYVPRVYWDFTTQNILVMERIYGTPIGEIETLKQKNINFKKLAENGVKVFFTQVFKHNFFHADMHPGNIFVGDDGTYKGVDFGIMGRLSKEDMLINANLFSGFFHQDYQKIAKTFINAGWVNKNSNIISLENSIRTICAPMFAKPLGDISFGEVLMNLFAEARKFDAYIQPQFLLFDKTLLNIEGLGRQLYPKLNLWETAKPLLDEIMQKQYNIKDKIKKLPKTMIQTLNNLQNLQRIQEQQTAEIINQLQKTNQQQNKILISIAIILLLSIIL